jgi:ArsR family transcriptional regulator
VQSYPSFLSYVEDLAATKPEVLRDRWINGTWTLCEGDAVNGDFRGPSDLLESIDNYMAFLKQNFENLKYDPEIEAEAFVLAQKPERMQAMMIEHLRGMWNDFLAAEWARVRPMLQEAVEAYQRLPLDGLGPIEATEKVIGQPLKEAWHAMVANAEQLTFVPSAHIGPYLAKLSAGTHRWLLFGARSPHGIERGLSALSSSELLVRINALSDSTRLRMLALLVEHDELCAQDLIAKLDVSQPAASRHLRQLVASGYVTERWRDGSKCYQLNRARIADTIAALERFFQTR